MSTWAVYLQGNDEFGGGLTLAPGSHKLPDPYVELRKESAEKYRRGSEPGRFAGVRDRLRKFGPLRAVLRAVRAMRAGTSGALGAKNPGAPGADPMPFVDIKSEPGDLVCFNTKAWHRATPWQVAATSNEKRKLAIFFLCGADNETTQQYREWINTYHESKRLGTHEVSEDLKAFLAASNIKFI